MRTRSSPPPNRRSSTAPTGPTPPASSRSCSARRWSSSSIRRRTRSRGCSPSITKRTPRRVRARPHEQQWGGPHRERAGHGRRNRSSSEAPARASRGRALLGAPPRAVGSPGDRMALEAGGRLALLSTPARAAGGSEARTPAYRYGIVLLLLFATFIFLAIGPTGDWVPLVAVVLQGATLLAALSASGSGHRLRRIAIAVVILRLVAATGFGRALAVLEALIGQLYLVTVIALLVSNLGPARRRRAREADETVSSRDSD